MFTYTRLITDEEERILKDSILDIKDWIDKAIKGKISSCGERLAIKRRDELIKSGETTIPANNLDLARNAFADSNYKNRSQRDLEEELRGNQ